MGLENREQMKVEQNEKSEAERSHASSEPNRQVSVTQSQACEVSDIFIHYVPLCLSLAH